MISTYALSVFHLHHHLNGLGIDNLCLVQEVMCASNLATDKSKNVCKTFPNLAILTKSSTPGEIQLIFGHAAVGNKSLGDFVVDVALTGDLRSPSVILYNIKIYFAVDSENIRLLIAEILLPAAANNLA